MDQISWELREEKEQSQVLTSGICDYDLSLSTILCSQHKQTEMFICFKTRRVTSLKESFLVWHKFMCGFEKILACM